MIARGSSSELAEYNFHPSVLPRVCAMQTRITEMPGVNFSGQEMHCISNKTGHHASTVERGNGADGLHAFYISAGKLSEVQRKKMSEKWKIICV